MLYFWRGLAMQPRKELYICKSIYLLLSFFFIIITSKVKSFYIDSILIAMIKHCAVLTKTWKEWAKHKTKPHRRVTHFFTKYILRVQEAKQTTDTCDIVTFALQVPASFKTPQHCDGCLPHTVKESSFTCTLISCSKWGVSCSAYRVNITFLCNALSPKPYHGQSKRMRYSVSSSESLCAWNNI